MTDQLPIVIILGPLLGAILAAFTGWFRPRLSHPLVVLGLAISFAAALKLVFIVADAGAQKYWLGGWGEKVIPGQKEPFVVGIQITVDYLNTLLLVAVSGIALLTSVYTKRLVDTELAGRQRYFYALFSLLVTGLLGITITGDIFNLYVFMEIAALSSYALIAMGRGRRALTAAFGYLVMGTIGSTLIVIGIGLLYVMTGTLNMADLAQILPELEPNRTIPVAFTFLTVGITLKLALFPLHLWLPNAYTYAPSAVTAFIASTATKVAVYLLLRFFFTIFGASFSFGEMQLDKVLMPLALVAILTMSIVAIYQDNVKRLLAYSSVAQIGYMVLGISLASALGLTAGILHLFNHALMKGALFMAMGCVMYRVGSVRIERMNGLGRAMPWTMAAFVAGGLSIIGVPLTVGFISKWYLIQAALEQGLWPVAVVVLVGSLLAVVYVWKVVEVAYFRDLDADADIQEAPLSMLIATWALVLANFWFGIDASATTGVARRAAEVLLGVGS